MAKGVRKPANPKGPPCANCGEPLIGHWCHACGQKAHLHHKLSHLLEEFAEGIAHFDGRLWRTLPVLALNPGRLSREWREGKRMRYVAPLHVFLFAVFLMFVAPSLTGQKLINFGDSGLAGAPVDVNVNLGDDSIQPGNAVTSPEKSLQKKIEHKLEDPEFLAYKLSSLAYKLSFVMVPISMGILWLLQLGRRGFTLYDHAVVSLYGLGFSALMITLISVIPGASDNGYVSMASTLALALHAAGHLKGAYRLSWFGATVRAALLSALTILGFGLFLLGVATLGFLA
jgi:uncharacterized membrane protein